MIDVTAIDMNRHMRRDSSDKVLLSTEYRRGRGYWNGACRGGKRDSWL